MNTIHKIAAIIAGIVCSINLPGRAATMNDTPTSASVITLPHGPNIDGIVLVQQSAWPQDVIDAFHRTPWLDAASIRMPWRELEPEDQKFDWSAIDQVLAEVKKWNAAHVDQPARTMHIRVMAGIFSPSWFNDAGVKMYETHHYLGPTRRKTPLVIPLPYDNPEFMKQLREVYRAMREHYENEPLITMYHGTWSAGPWDEIFHPMDDQPYPPDYSKEKFVQGMLEQLDILIEEFALKGKVCELPYSGKYPSRSQIDITGPLTRRINERLGKRSPFLYIQSNGWGANKAGVSEPTMGHLDDFLDAYGKVNLALQAVGTNAGGGWWPQGDWIKNVETLQKYDIAYAEIYPPDIMPLDEKNHITEAFTHEPGDGDSFIGFRPWIKQRRRMMYVRDAAFTRTFATDGEARKLAQLWVAESVPADTSTSYRLRMSNGNGDWSQWVRRSEIDQLPEGKQLEVEVTLHTDDGHQTPVVAEIRPSWKMEKK